LTFAGSVNSSAPSKLTHIQQQREASLHAGWRKLDIKGRVTMRVPKDMKSAELLGDAFAHREAYRNKKIYMTIVYGEISPNRDKRGLPFDACDTSHLTEDQTTYEESVMDVAGRKAKLGIDSHLRSEYVIASLCMPPNEKGVQLIVVAYCKDDHAVDTARQIFTSVRFKE